MQLNGVGHQERGHLLLLAAQPHSARRQLLDPDAGTTALGSIPTALLLGSYAPADTVTLVDPREPQAVVGRLRTAASTPGPLFVYLAGQLVADRRRSELHLALANTAPLTVRYTALAWEWIGRELLQRPRGTRTTVLVDLVAEERAWSALLDDPQALRLPPEAELWGTVSPPPSRKEPPAGTAYTERLAELLRTGTGRGVADLHALAAGQAHLRPDALLLAPYAPVPAGPAALPPVPAPRPAALPSAPSPAPRHAEEPAYMLAPPVPAPLPPGPLPPSPVLRSTVPPQDSTPLIAEALHQERYAEADALAAAWEQRVLRTQGPNAYELASVAAAQAQIAVTAGNLRRGAERWMWVAHFRMMWTSPEDARVITATANAEHVWHRLTGPDALDVGAALVELRRKVNDGGNRLQAVERRLQMLRTAASGAPQKRAQN